MYFYLNDTKKSAEEVHLLNYLEDNEYYKNKLNKQNKNSGSKKKESKKTPSKSDDFIDTETQEFLFDLKNETKNKFIYQKDKYIIYITTNPYLIEVLDFANSTRTILHSGFKIMKIETNNKKYYRRGYECELLIIFGAEEVLFVLFCLKGSEKFYETVLHLTDLEYFWDKMYFITDDTTVVRNENSELYYIDLTCLNQHP